MDNIPYAHEVANAIHKFHSEMRKLNISVRITGLSMSPVAEMLLKRSIEPAQYSEVVKRQIVGVPYVVEDFK